jgi:hypothetical protein
LVSAQGTCRLSDFLREHQINRDPGNAILLNGAAQTANREVGVPGFQPTTPRQIRNPGLEQDQAAADAQGHGFGAAGGPELAED